MNKNQQKEKTSKSSALSNLLIILLIAIIMVTSSIGIFAWAKYTSATDGNATAQVAKWSFKVVDGVPETSDVIEFAVTRTDGYEHVEEGKLAPGTFGEFQIGIDATGTETVLTYTIEAELTTKPTNLKLYADSAKQNEIKVVNDRIIIEEYLSLEQVKEVQTKTIYWEWPYETGDLASEIVSNDAKDTIDAGKTMTMVITVTGTEVLEEPQYLVKQITAANYGDAVNYSVTVKNGVQVAEGTEGATTLDNWKVFYNDGSNVYVIYGDYMPNAAVNIEKTGMMVNGTYRAGWVYNNLTVPRNEAAVATLTNTENWEQLVTQELIQEGVTATGGVTLNTWVNSWNEKGYTKLYTSRDDTGYFIGTTENPTKETSITYDGNTGAATCLEGDKIDEIGGSDKLYFPRAEILMDPNTPCLGYWLATPAWGSASDSIQNVSNEGAGTHWGNPCVGLRGVICIPSNIVGAQDENGAWNIIVD